MCDLHAEGYGKCILAIVPCSRLCFVVPVRLRGTYCGQFRALSNSDDDDDDNKCSSKAPNSSVLHVC